MRIVPILIANLDTGEGAVKFGKFLELHPLLRADLLKDWMDQLKEIYNQSVSEAFGPREENND